MVQRFQITKAAELESLQVFRDFIDECCTSFRISSEVVFDLKLAVDEACTNIITHGYAGMDPGSIILSIRIEEERILVQITDFGHVFEPVEMPLPDAAAALKNEILGGFGLYFIYQTMDNIEYKSNPEGNALIFTKYYESS